MRKKLLSLLLCCLMATGMMFAGPTYALQANFEGGSLPAGWVEESELGVNPWTVQDSAAAVSCGAIAPLEGNYCLTAPRNTQSNSAVARIVTPAMDVRDINLPVLTFARAQRASNGRMDTLSVYYRMAAEDEWHLLQKFTSSTNGLWKKESVLLVGTNTRTYQLAFVMENHASRGVQLDDIKVMNTSMCENVSDFQISTTATTAQVYFSGIDGLSAEYVLSSRPMKNPSAQGDTAVVRGSMTPNTVNPLTNLTPNKLYYIYVRTNCPDNETGYTEWVSASFRTKVQLKVPYQQTFNDATGNAIYGMLNGWTAKAGDEEGQIAPFAVKTGASKHYSLDNTTFLAFAAEQTTTPETSPLAPAQKQYLITPEIKAESLSGLELSFDATAYTAVGAEYASGLIVGVLESPDNLTIEPIDTVYLDYANQHKHFTVSFASYAGTGKFIVLYSDFNKKNFIAIDNFALKQAVSAPNHVSLSQINEQGFTVSAALHGAQTWNVRVYEAAKFVSGGALPAGEPLVALANQPAGAVVVAADTLKGKAVIVYTQAVAADTTSAWSFPEVAIVPSKMVLPLSIDFSSASCAYNMNQTIKEYTGVVNAYVPAGFTASFDGLSANVGRSLTGDNRFNLNGAGNYLISSYIDSITSCEVIFELLGADARVRVSYLSNVSDLQSAVVLGTFVCSDAKEAKKVTMDMDNYLTLAAEAGGYLMLEALSESNQIDNMQFHKIPALRIPFAVSSVVTPDSVVLSWESNHMSEWNVRVADAAGKVQYAQDLKVNEFVTDTFLVLKDLDKMTTLYYSVESTNAEHTAFSQSAQVYSFATLADMPYESAMAELTGWSQAMGDAQAVIAGTDVLHTSTAWKASTVAVVGMDAHVAANVKSVYNWLISPRMLIKPADAQEEIYLTFDLAVLGNEENVANHKMQILVSEDAMQTWTICHTEANLMPYHGAAKTFRLSLNSLVGKQIQFAIVTGTEEATAITYHLANVKVASKATDCMGITSLALKSAGVSSAELVWHAAGAQVADVWYINVDSPKDTVRMLAQTDTLISLTDLLSSSTYEVAVRQACDVDAQWTRLTFKTEMGVPYKESFSSALWPSDWKVYSGAKEAFFGGTATAVNNPTSSSIYWNTNHTYSAAGYGLSSRHARCEIYGSNNYWMVSPTIHMEEVAAGLPIQLSFDMALTYYNSAAAATGGDDKRIWLAISEDGGLTWNEDSAYVWTSDSLIANPYAPYLSIPATGQRYTFDMSAYAGKAVAIAFGVESSTTTDHSVHVGNVNLKVMDPNCMGVTELTATALVEGGANITWTAIGDQNVHIQISDKENFSTLLMDTTVAEAPIFFANVAEKKTYYVRATQLCATDWTVVSFKRPEHVTPFTQTFGGASMPAGWEQWKGDPSQAFAGVSPSKSGSGWSITTTSNGLPANHTKINIWSSTNNTWLVSPNIAVANIADAAEEAINFSFDFAYTDWNNANSIDAGSDQALLVLASTDNGATWKRENSWEWSHTDQQAAVKYNLPASGTLKQNCKIDFTRFAGQNVRIAFVVVTYNGDNDFHIANVKLKKVDAACQGLNMITATNVQPTSATLEFAAGGSQEVLYAVADSASFSELSIKAQGTATDGSVEVTGLLPNTLYYVRARQACDVTGDTLEITFQTPCTAVEPLAYSTDFSGTAATCWTYGFAVGGLNGAAEVLDDIYGSHVRLAKTSVNTSSSEYADKAYAISPELNLGEDSIMKYQIVFEAVTGSQVSSNVGAVQVGVITDLNDLSTYVPVDTIALNYGADSLSFDQYVVSFASYEGDYNGEFGKYVMFVAEGGAENTNDVRLTNVRFAIASTCEQITSAHMDHVGTTSAVYAWDSKGAAQHEVMLTANRCNPDTMSAPLFRQVVDVDSIVLTGLTPATQYFAYVRGICAEGDSAMWSSATPFSTAYGVPYLETFDQMEAYPTDKWKGYRGSSIVVNDVFEPGTASLNTTTSNGWYVTEVPTDKVTGMSGNAARIEIYSSSYNGVLTSPSVYLEPSADPAQQGMRLTFKIAATPWSASGTVADAADHAFTLMVSEDNGISYHPYLKWASDGSGDYDFNSIKGNAVKADIDVTEYAGKNISLAFFTSAVTYSPDTYFYLDSVAVNYYDNSCVRVTKLEAKTDTTTAVLTWKRVGQGDAIITVANDAAFKNVVLKDTLDADSLVMYDLQYGKTYYAKAKLECGGDSALLRFSMPKSIDSLTTTLDGTTLWLDWKTPTHCDATVEIATTTDFSAGTVVYSNGSVGELPHRVDGLNWDTEYYVRIMMNCTSDTVLIPVTIPIDPSTIYYKESFASSTWPSDWSRLMGTSNDFFGGTTTNTTSGWSTNSYPNYGLPGYHAGCEIYSTSYNYWMVSPIINLEEWAGLPMELSFDMALTYWNTAAAPATGSTDDRVWVAIGLVADSTTTNWDRQNTVLWSANSADARDYDYYSIPVANGHYAFDFSQYAGQKVRVAFGVETPVAGTDNRIHVANVSVLQARPCAAEATNLHVAEVAGTTATLVWEGDETLASELQLSTAPDFKKGLTIVSVASGLTATVENLQPGKTYFARVRQLCSAAEAGQFTRDFVAFNTDCEAKSLPWKDDFEAYPIASNPIAPACWDILNANGEGQVNIFVNNNSTYVVSGKQSLYFQPVVANKKGYAVLPEVNAPTDSLEMTFSVKFASTYYGDLDLGCMVEEGDTVKYVNIVSVPASTSWARYSVRLNVLPDSLADARLAFRYSSTYSSTTSYQVALDDIELKRVPFTPTPEAPQVVETKIGRDTVVIAWPAVEADHYLLKLTSATDTIQAVVADTCYTIRGLVGSTTYTYEASLTAIGQDTSYVRTSTLIFTTSCVEVEASKWKEGFESAETNKLPACWTAFGKEGKAYVKTGAAHTGSKSLYLGATGDTTLVMTVLPQFDQQLDTMRLDFYYWSSVNYSSSKYDTAYVGVLSDPFDSTTFVVVDTLAQVSSYTHHVTELVGIPATHQYLAICYNGGTSTYASFNIDDMKLTPIPFATTIDTVLVSNVERRSFDAKWVLHEKRQPSATYELVLADHVMTAEALADTTKITVADTTGYHFEGLERDTQYYLYVRSTVLNNGVAPAWAMVAVKTLPLQVEEEQQIGSGSGSETTLPSHMYYKYGYSEQIYKASEINKVGTITSMAFLPKFTSASGKARKIAIYMKHTKRSSISGTSDWTTMTAADKVAEVNSVSFAANEWYEFVFTKPFVYNGVDNLLVVVDDNAGGYDANGKNFATYTASNYEAIYQYSDGDNQNPLAPAYAGTRSYSKNQIKLHFTITADACPLLETVEAVLTGDHATSARIAWTESTGDYVGSYDVVYADSALTAEALDTIVPQFTGIDTLSVELTGLSPLTTYYAYVRTVCDAEGHDDGKSEWNQVVFKTDYFCHGISNLEMEVTAVGEAKATWNPSDQPNAFQYILSLEKLSVAELETAAPTVSGLTDTVAELTNLLPDTTYYFYVANTYDGYHSQYLLDSIHTPDACPAVTNIQLEQLTANVALISWESGQYGEETEWEVGIVGQAESAETVNVRSAIFFGLTAETEYVLYVKSLCSAESASKMDTIRIKTKNGAAEGELGAAIGEGTASANLVFTSWGNTYSQQIYTAEELNALGYTAGTITALQFDYSGVSSTYNKKQSIYIGFANIDSYSGYTATDFVPADEMELVYGPEELAYQAGWRTYTLSNPIDWDGTSNIVIGVLTNQPDGVSQSSASGWSASGTSTSPAYCSIERHRDNSQIDVNNLSAVSYGSRSNYRPNLKLSIAAASTGALAMPTKLKVTDVKETSASISWFPGGQEQDWTYVVSPVELTENALGYDPTIEHHELHRQVEVALNGLTPDVDYHFYIRSNIGEQHSDWADLPFTTLPTCLVPMDLHVVDAAETEVTVAWKNETPDFGGDYLIYYGKAETFNIHDDQTYEQLVVVDTVAVLTNLEGNTAYKMVVRGNCDETMSSRWSSEFAFRTTCAIVRSYPWYENFDSRATGNFKDDCWINEHIAGTRTDVFTVSSTKKGDNETNKLRLPDQQVGNVTRLYLPEMYVRRAGGIQFSMDIYRSAYDKADEGIRVFVADEDGEETELGFIPRQFTRSSETVAAVAAIGWYSYSFPIPVEGNVRVILQGESQYGEETLMDNFVLDSIASCAMPTGLKADSIKLTSALLEWDYVGAKGEVEVSTAADFSNIVFTTDIEVSDSTLQLVDLTSNTEYYVRMRYMCTDIDISGWTSMSFQTAIGIPFMETFNGDSKSLPSWKKYTGLVEDAFEGTLPTTTTSGWTSTTVGDGFTGEHYKLNIWGTGAKYWLVSPAIVLGEEVDAYISLSFEAALTKYNSSLPPSSTAMEDDKFMVLISTDDGQTWSRDNATVWSNDGTGDYVYSDVPAVATPYAIDLSRYAGQSIRVALYGESTESGADNDFHVDNLRINTAMSVEEVGHLCAGEEWYDPMHHYDVPADIKLGEYTFSGLGLADVANAADTIFKLTLTVGQSVTIEKTATYCYGETAGVEFGLEPFIAEQSGTIYFNEIAANGCDSTVILFYEVIQPVYAEKHDTITKGDIYEFAGQRIFSAGVYRDTLISEETGCDSIITLYLAVVEPVGFENIRFAELTVAPNPVSVGEAFTVMGNVSAQARIEIYSSTGALCYTQQVNGLPAEVPGLPAAGIYLVRIKEGDTIHECKLVVK